MCDKKRVALLSNITVDLIINRLRKKYEFYHPEGFDTWVQEVINPSSKLHNTNADAFIVLLDGTEARVWGDIDEARDRVNLWKQAVNTLVDKKTGIPIFVSTLDIRENRIKSLSERLYKYEVENDWYQFIYSITEKHSNVYIFDICDTVSDIGRNNFYSNKVWYMSSMPYSRDGLVAICREIERALGSIFEARKKIIVLDLDNTLWGGVIGEDGIDGIELSNHKEGQRYFDFQRQLLEMKNRGIVLAINSKNNLKDVEEVLQNHPSMLLRDGDFVSKKINWENKAINIKTIADELNITESGFIFVDDNPVERQIVGGECSEVLVADFPSDSTELLNFAEDIWFDYCRPPRILDEDLKKTLMYQVEAKRKQVANKKLDLDDYIATLEMKIDIHKMRESEQERVVQLINKTNQFNLTTRRYSHADIKEIASNPNNIIYVVYCSDKFGDSGLISVIIIKDRNEDIFIDTFLMSCRVMGRKIENLIINELASHYRGKKFVGEFISTEKNAPVQDLYDRLGFRNVLSDDYHKLYELGDYQRKKIDYCKEIRFEK